MAEYPKIRVFDPLLGPVDLTRLPNGCGETFNAITAEVTIYRDGEEPHTFRASDVEPIEWVIVAGETGPRARPMHPDWVRSIRDQCQAAGVPFFFAGWGEWAPIEKHHVMVPSGNYAFLPSGEKVVPELERRQIHIWPAEQVTNDDSFSAIKVGKENAGRLLDGRTWDEFPAGKTE